MTEDIPSSTKKRAAPIDPTQEENFPDNPTRRAADREMNEPSNLRPSARPTPRSDVPVRELEEEEE